MYMVFFTKLTLTEPMLQYFSSMLHTQEALMHLNSTISELHKGATMMTL